jgi:acyl-CoA synthetase (AMP-forming)/AMP-acid ligase II
MRPTMLVNVLSRGLADRPAVSDAGTMRLDYAQLCNAADAIGAGLAARGVLPGDVVAAAIPGGVAYLVAFTGTATARAALAPLAPGDETDPRERLSALGARFILATAEVPQAIRVAAAGAGIPLTVLDFDDQGVVRLDGEQVFEANVRLADPDDVVLITADGPLTHHEVVAEALAAAPAGAAAVRTTLSLLERRGLVAALTVLAAGGQAIVPSEDAAVAA